MKLILDTHAFLWWVGDDSRLTTGARRLIGQVENQCFLSLASCWELAIKHSLGKLTLEGPFESFVAEHLSKNGFGLLPIEFRHLVRLTALPFHHRDPFDRLLAAQAIEEQLVLVSADLAFDDYPVVRRW